MSLLSERKTKNLLLIAAVYLLAYLIALPLAFCTEYEILRFLIWDVTATVIVYFFSVLFHNSSMYDPYWSVTPMVMILTLFLRHRAFSLGDVVFLIFFLLWGVRLTANWCVVFTDFSYEDWRYRHYRENSSRFFWPVINFFGIHMMPTLLVFAAFLPVFVLARKTILWSSLPGMLLMGGGTALEFLADRDMHMFLQTGIHGSVCQVGLWNYSRHPNYLGENVFWWGVYLTMLPVAPDLWYTGIGAAGILCLFLFVSIPLMENRQCQRRPGYFHYRQSTSRLLLWPKRR